MRLEALIIFSIEWNSEELILRGKQLKYWSRKLGKFHTKSKNSLFFKIALNRLLTLAKDRSRREILESSGIIDLQNNGVLKQFKHWNFRILVPMSYITLWDHFGSQNVDFSLILYRFYKQNVILTRKMSIFRWFYKGWRK